MTRQFGTIVNPLESIIIIFQLNGSLFSYFLNHFFNSSKLK